MNWKKVITDRILNVVAWCYAKAIAFHPWLSLLYLLLKSSFQRTHWTLKWPCHKIEFKAYSKPFLTSQPNRKVNHSVSSRDIYHAKIHFLINKSIWKIYQIQFGELDQDEGPWPDLFYIFSCQLFGHDNLFFTLLSCFRMSFRA